MWKSITGYEGIYEISDAGEIKSIQRVITDAVGHTYTIRERILKTYQLPNGYLTVTLCKNNQTRRYYIHRLVAETFIPNPLNLPIINHKNGNKQNCHAYNLEWSTYSDNNQHAYDTGLKPRGEGQYKAVLTEQQVREIKRLGKYTTYQAIADKYNVTKATIRDVLIGKTWKTIY